MRNKLKWLLSVLFIFTIVGWCFYQSKISYRERLRHDFGLDITGFSSKLLEEKRDGEIDAGYYFAKIKFENAVMLKEVIKQKKFKKLPLKIDLPIYQRMSDIISDSSGYGCLDQISEMNYKIIVLDDKKNELIVYSQYF